MTATDESKRIVDRLHREVFQQGGMDLLPEIVADHLVVHHPEGDLTRDQLFGEELPRFLRAFPDLALHLLDSIAEGDKVVTRYVFTGTHQGELQGVPATGKKIEFPGITIHRVEAGKVAEVWVQRNDLGLLQQLGAIPLVAS